MSKNVKSQKMVIIAETGNIGVLSTVKHLLFTEFMESTHF